MGDPVRIAFVGDHPGQLVGDGEPPLRLGEQHDPAVETDPPAIEPGGDLLALDGWKRERQQAIVDHRGCGSLESRTGMALTPNSYAISSAYATSASPPAPRLHKMG
jgi:hypothetical protein